MEQGKAGWHLIRGSDYFLVRRALRKILGDASHTRIDCPSENNFIQRLSEALRSEDLFSPVEAVVADNVGYLSLSAGELKELADLLERFSDRKLLIFVHLIEEGERKLEDFGRTKTYRLLSSPPGKVVDTDREMGRRARVYDLARELAREQGLEIEQEALKLLVESAGFQPVVIDSELRKLAIIYGQEPIGKKAVEEAIYPNPKTNFFRLSELLMQGDPSALPYLRRLLREGHEPLAILSWTTRQFRLAYLISLGALDHPEVARIKGVRWRFDPLERSAHAWRPPRLRQALLNLSQVELDLKSGRVVALSSRQAQEEALIAELARVAELARRVWGRERAI